MSPSLLSFVVQEIWKRVFAKHFLLLSIKDQKFPVKDFG